MTNTSVYQNNQITKFQDLDIDETYSVVEFRPIKGKFGPSNILKVIKNGEDEGIEIFSVKSINEYFAINQVPRKFEFTVRRFTTGKYIGKRYAEIDGINYAAKAGFIKLM